MSEGKIFKNADGRWQLKGGNHFTSGEIAELLIGGHWFKGCVYYVHETRGYVFLVDGVVTELRDGMTMREVL